SKQVPGWQSIEGFSVDKYGSVGSEWDYGLSGCPSCKDYYLRLEFEGSVHELSTSQKVNIAVAASQVDAGEVKATISAYLGAFIGADTSSEIIAVYQDASGKELGRTTTQQYNTNTLAKAEKGSTGLILCEASGMVPVGTRTIVYIWKAEATGESNSYLALG